MLNILINAYACAPEKGSEPGMAWNWIINIAKYCRVFIITEGEWKNEIEHALLDLPEKNNIRFYFNPVSQRIRNMCWNQGDWRFYFFYNKWQHSTLKIAKKIVQEYPIDIVHQLNMIGFREPGYLWKLNKPFIWGPIGGTNNFPSKYLIGASLKMKIGMTVKNIINTLQVKYSVKVKRAVKYSDILISAIPETKLALSKHYKRDSILIPETGTYDKKNYIRDISFFTTSKSFNLLWVGKFDFMKRLDLALKSVSKLKHFQNIKLHIVGTGNNKQIKYYTNLVRELGIEKMVIWEGKLPNKKVLELMQKSHLFFFTSVSEATSTVVLESISNHLPVLCFNTCGFGPIVDPEIGVKIELSNPDISVDEFAEEIEKLYKNRNQLISFSEKCLDKKKKLSWVSKGKEMFDIYKELQKLN